MIRSALMLAMLTLTTPASAEAARLDQYLHELLGRVQHELAADDFLSDTHRLDRQLVEAYLALHHGKRTEAANAFLAGLSLDRAPREWKPDEWDTADWNFTGIKALRLWLDFRDDPALSGAASRHLRSFLAEFPQPRTRHNHDNDRRAVWPGIHTENHDLSLLTLGYFRAYLNGEDLASHEAHLARSLMWRMQMGWLEANSPTYQVRYAEPLGLLADHAPDPRIREGAEALLNHILAERVLFLVDGVLVGPQHRTRKRPDQPYKDEMNALTNVWFGSGTADRRRAPTLHGYWLARSGFKPDPAVVALAASRRERDAPPIVYRGVRVRRGGEYTEFRYYVSPNVGLASTDHRGFTRQHRHHYALLARSDGPPSGAWFHFKPPDGPSDPRFGVSDSVQWEDAMLVRGELQQTGDLEELSVAGWRVLATDRAALAVMPLPQNWNFVVALGRVGSGDVLMERVAAIQAPRWSSEGVEWVSCSGQTIGFVFRPERPFHDVFIDGTRVIRPNGMLHDAPVLKSWYGTGIVDVIPAGGPMARLTAEPLRELLLDAATGDASQPHP
ncbi:MAG: hypothetical protein AAGH92_09555 [Planctomycetota bacterium]